FALRLPQLFVVEEEEQLVLLDGPSNTAAKLILAVGRYLRRVKEVAPVQVAVAEEFVQGAVKTVGAGFAGRIHHRAIAAELSAIGVGEDLEFGDGFNTEGSAQHARTRPVGPEALNVDIVQKIRLAFRPGAGNAEVSLQAVQQVRAAGWRPHSVSSCDSWRQRNQVRKIAAVQRQVRNLFLFHHRG